MPFTIQPLGRRAALGLAAASLAGAAGAATTLPQAARVVTSAAGSAHDAVSRLLAEQLRGSYAPVVVVENRVGASGRISVEYVKSAAPDGATMWLGPMPILTLFPHDFPKTTRYDALVDFVPVATVATVQYAWTVQQNHPARTVAEFLAWAKAKGGANFAPSAIGAPQHLIGLEVARRSGAPLTAVSYRGPAAGLQDLMAGQIDLSITNYGDAAGLLAGGALRLLAVGTEDRLPAWPQVQTLAEAGLGDLPTGEAFALLVPAGTPQALVAALAAATAQAVQHPAMLQGLARLDAAPLVLSPAATTARIRAERDAWGAIVQATGFSAEA